MELAPWPYEADSVPAGRFDLIVRTVAGLRYKPTAQLRFDGGELEIVDTFVDVQTDENREFTWVAGVPPRRVLEEPDDATAMRLLKDWIWAAVAYNELHEIGEWLQDEEGPIYDPHSDPQLFIAFQFPNGEDCKFERLP